jgi:O-antigen/teichoic acid export membrane protein
LAEATAAAGGDRHEVAGAQPAGPATTVEPPGGGSGGRRRAQSSGTASTLALGGAAVTTAANFGIAMLVGRAGAAFAGVFFAATAIVTILGNSAGLGTMTGQVYFMPLAVDGPDPNPRSLLRIAIGPVALASAVAALLLVLMAGAAAGVIAPAESSEIAGLLRLLAVTVPAWAITVPLLGATRGLGSMTPTVAVNQLLKPLGQLVSMGVLFAADPAPSGLAVAAAWAWPVVAAPLAAVGALWRLGGLAGGGRPSAVTSSEYWRYTWPRAIATTCQIGLERLDVVLVSALAGASAAGVYGAISRYVTAGNFLIFSIGQATSPSLRRSLASGDLDAAERLLRRATGWMVMLVWPYFLLLAVQADPLARLLNPAFAPGAGALSILAGGMLVSALAGPIDLTLLMLGRSRASLAGTALALAADIVLAWLLVPAFGIVGAAIAWAAAVGLQNGIAALVVHRTAGLRATGRAALTAAVGATLCVIPLGLIAPGSVAGLLVTAAGAGLAYAAWLARFGPVLGLPERLTLASGRLGAVTVRRSRTPAGRSGSGSRHGSPPP